MGSVSAAHVASDFGAQVLPIYQETTGTAAANRLAGEHQAEVLAFLAMRPIHTAIMSGLIRDNGIVSPLNRGTFYAYRNRRGGLEGVSLIGHVTLIEARSLAALEAFAGVAQESSQLHVILAEREKIELFWSYYAQGGQGQRLLCRELLFEQRCPVEAREPIRGLRLATLDELEPVMLVQAQMAFDEGGVNPMRTDPLGFRLRCARRIEQGRVWVWVESGRLIFKADILADTPEVNYLEGVWVNPQERGKGYGAQCISQLSRQLLTRTKALTVLVNEQAQQAQALYRKAGYRLRSCYDTVYFHR
jgi:ribosomal protein S18 acetylase RimI-like enzyme